MGRVDLGFIGVGDALFVSGAKAFVNASPTSMRSSSLGPAPLSCHIGLRKVMDHLDRYSSRDRVTQSLCVRHCWSYKDTAATIPHPIRVNSVRRTTSLMDGTSLRVDFRYSGAQLDSVVAYRDSLCPFESAWFLM